MKYILVTGGVINGIGKSIIASSIGHLLQDCNLSVTFIKIDPYINIDVGALSESQNGEVYVLDDGGEVDCDLGNYERFLNISLHSDNHLTMGKIYEQIFRNENLAVYMDVTNTIIEWIERVAKIPVSKTKEIPQVCIIELGGVIGDFNTMPFVKAFQQFQSCLKKEDFCIVHVSLIIQSNATGETKTKPVQSSIKKIHKLGLYPDLIFCRSEKPTEDDIKTKISIFCYIAAQKIIKIPDLSSTYKVPFEMKKQNVVGLLNQILQLNIDSTYLQRKIFEMLWFNWINPMVLNSEVNIALVGVRTKNKKFYSSVFEALQHAAATWKRRLKLTIISAAELEESMIKQDHALYYEAWENLQNCNGVIIPGSFNKNDVEGKIAACKYCRETNKPFLGISSGFICAVIEFARNVLGFEDANCADIHPGTRNPVIIDMPERNENNTKMRLGKRTIYISNTNSIIYNLYGSSESIEERHRNRFEVNPKYVGKLEAAGMKFIGKDVEEKRMEIMELKEHYYYVATQYHPEFSSRPLIVSPPFYGLICASMNLCLQCNIIQDSCQN